MASNAVVHGLPKLQRALKTMERNAARYARDACERAAAPIVDTARSRKGRYPGAPTGNIHPRTSRQTVYVEDRTPPHTGLRGDFGSLIMRNVMLPALYEHQEDVVRELDRTLDKLAKRAGF